MTKWVFGYGSLLWNPGFEYEESVIATLPGWQRSFCMSSIHHRGTEEKPGLVLALDAVSGSKCQGVALSVPEDRWQQTWDYLRERELISSAYLEEFLPVELADGRQVEALSYVIDPSHNQYRGDLSLEEQAHIISAAHGGRGPNADYLYNTASHLRELGLRDEELDWLSDRVREILS